MNSSDQQPRTPRDTENWTKSVDCLNVTGTPTGALNLNAQGRQTLSPLKGFGQLWQQTFQTTLVGSNHTPAEIVRGRQNGQRSRSSTRTAICGRGQQTRSISGNAPEGAVNAANR